MIKSKKADISGEKIIFYIANVFVLAFLFLFIAGLIFTTKASKVGIPEGLENFIFIQRFTSSPHCFTYQDPETNRYYTGTIDWNKFTEYNLNYCYDSENKNVKEFQLKLMNLRTNKNTTKIKTKNWVGRVDEEREKNVRIYKEGNFYDGKLIVEIQNAKK